MGTSDAKCAARNIRKNLAFKTLGVAGGLLSNKKKLLEPYTYRRCRATRIITLNCTGDLC